MKSLIGINTLTELNQMVYANHLQFSFRLAKNNPEDEFLLFTPRRMGIDRFRNECVKLALANGIDYIMFIDDDVLVPPDAYRTLKKHDKDVVAGWTVIRGYPFNNMHFTFQEKDGYTGLHHYNDHSETDGLIKVDAIGCSCCLIKTEVFKKIPPPYFLTGPFNTEDIYFCMKAREHIKDFQIWVDLSVKTGHILGTEFITPEEKPLWLEFEKKRNPDVEDVEKKDRGAEYLEEVKSCFA